MSEDGGFRRLTPPPRRWPGPLAVLVRWRTEIGVLAVGCALWRLTGPLGLGLAGVGIASLATASRRARRLLVGYALAVVVRHRVRVGLVQAGVTDRSGRLPWLLGARPGPDEDIVIGVWLRAGTTIGDLRVAIPILAGSCGARSVTVTPSPSRADRALLAVGRPRWPWPLA